MAASTVIFGICRHMSGTGAPRPHPVKSLPQSYRSVRPDFQAEATVKYVRLLLVIGALGAAPSAHAAPEATIVPTNDDFHGPCGSSEEDLTLVISEMGREITKSDYCSSYGKSSVRIVSDQIGRNYVAVEYGEGRGTRAVTRFLLVYHLDGINLHEILRVPIEWATGLNGDWIFQYSFDRLRPSGLQITLRRVGNGEGDECCTLPEPTMTISIGAR